MEKWRVSCDKVSCNWQIKQPWLVHWILKVSSIELLLCVWTGVLSRFWRRSRTWKLARSNSTSQWRTVKNWKASMSAFCALAVQLRVLPTGGTVTSIWGQLCCCSPTAGWSTAEMSTPRNGSMPWGTSSRFTGRCQSMCNFRSGYFWKWGNFVLQMSYNNELYQDVSEGTQPRKGDCQYQENVGEKPSREWSEPINASFGCSFDLTFLRSLYNWC